MPIINPPTDISIVAVLPAILIALTALAVLMLTPILPRDRQHTTGWVALGGILLTLAVCVGLWAGQSAQYAFSRGVVLDGFGLFFDSASLVGSAIAVLLSLNYLTLEDIDHGEYYSLLLFSIAGMMLLGSAHDLVVFFLALEGLSLALYVLAGFNRTSLRSEEAGMKYFLLGAFSFGFLLYGIALVYGATGVTAYTDIADALQRNGDLVTAPLMRVGIGLILVGFGFKLAFVPFHQWTPDVYDGAPTPVTAFMSVGTKVAVFGALLRMMSVAFPAMRADWSLILWGMAILTMLLGNVVALTQTSVKRLLAYSSIAQAGYVLIGVIARASDVSSAVPSVMFYLMSYTVMNLGAFAVVIALAERGEPHTNIEDYAGLGRRQPLLAGAMAVFMFSLAGIPPTAGFIGKFYLFYAAVEANYPELAIVGVIATAISVFYYLRIIVVMYLRQPDTSVAQTRLVVPGALSFSLMLTAVVTIGLGLFPVVLVWLTQAAQAAGQ